MSYDVKDFDLDVVQKSQSVPVVVDFWAAWCGPCKVLGPVLERLEKQYENRWELAKVDTDQHQEIARDFGIRGIPHVKMFVKGKPTAEFTGAIPEAAVVQWLGKSLPDPMKNEIEHAEILLGEGKKKEAIVLLRGILDRSPENFAARVLLAKALFPDNHQEAADLVDGIEADSEHFPLADAIRTVAQLESKLQSAASLEDAPVKQQYLSALEALSRKDLPAAIDGFIRVIRADKSYDSEGARRGCIALFRILGDEDPLTKTKRREFSGALFV
ncbi:MAG: tetratricopeptide repeat protein [Bacteroidota bacterium]